MIRSDQTHRGAATGAPDDADPDAKTGLAPYPTSFGRRRTNPMVRRAFACASTLLTSWCLMSCSSNGDLLEESENYEGSQAAAVAPVADRRPGGSARDERLPAQVQQSIRQQLDQSGIFAGVVALNSPGEGNEAEVIVEPVLVGPDGAGRDEVGLKVRVIEKTDRKIVLDETYRGSGSQGRALRVAVAELEEDLERRYGR